MLSVLLGIKEFRGVYKIFLLFLVSCYTSYTRVLAVDWKVMVSDLLSGLTVLKSKKQRKATLVLRTVHWNQWPYSEEKLWSTWSWPIQLIFLKFKLSRDYLFPCLHLFLLYNIIASKAIEGLEFLEKGLQCNTWIFGLLQDVFISFQHLQKDFMEFPGMCYVYLELGEESCFWARS